MKRSVFLPGFLLLIVIIAVHWQISWDGDDAWFRNMELSIPFFKERYERWSSRLLIEVVYIFFLKYAGFELWRIANIIVMWLLCRLLVLLACPRDQQARGMWWMFFIALCFPLYILHTAGWGATMAFYLWPGTAFLIALLPLKWFLEEGSGWQPDWRAACAIIATLPAMAFAVNFEQGWLMFCGIWMISLMLLRHHRAARPLLVVQGSMLAAFLTFVCASPGNFLRTKFSVFVYWQDFQTVNLFDKAVLSFDNMGMFFLTHELLMLPLTAALAVFVWRRRQDAFFRCIGLLPFLLKTGAMLSARSQAYHRLLAGRPRTMQSAWETFGLPFEQIATPFTAGHASAYLPMVASLFFFCGILLALYAYEGPTRRMFCWIVLFLLGIASSCALALSPTLFASSARVFFFQYLALIGIFLSCFVTEGRTPAFLGRRKREF